MKSATMTLVQRPIALAVTSALLLSACATQPRVHVPLAYEKSPEPTEYLQPPEANGLNVKVMPPTPLDLRSNVRATTALAAPAEHEEATITLGFDQVPLPVFIQTVYGSTLKKNFSMDPAVASRQDLVSLRTSTPQTPTQVAETVRMLLKSYGVAVSNLGGFFRIAPDNTQSGYTPELRRGRALPDVPLAMRPIFQLVDINTIMQHDAATTLKQLFGNRITIQEDATRNALLLSGQTDDIRAALDMIQVIDQPLMAGQQSVRITPTFWGVDEMTRRLGDVLNTEGYGVSVLTSNVTFNQYTRSPIVLMPVGPINSIMIFCRDRATLEHVVKWADELDQPSINKNSGFFSYQVKHSDAQALATILQGLTNGTTPDGKGVKASKVVVNPATNSLIFEGGAGEYSQYLSLLRELDKPTRSALIEVTVAQIDLSTAQQMGIQWGLAPKSINGTQYTYTADVNGIGVSSSTSSSTASTASSSSSSSTSGSTTDGAGGLVLQLLDSARAVRAQISALATQTKAKVLSTPSVMARNGEAAQITVGQDVPILSSQQSNASTGGGLLQTVQYRNVGVILTVRPVIHSSGRIDLDVSQEVSNVAAGSGVNSNPIFSSRKVNTKLSLRDGSTVMLAGLIQDNTGESDSGVPYLKDIPWLGNLFKTRSSNGSKTELVILITPYILNDDFEAESITDAFRDQLGPWAHRDQKLAPNMQKPTSAHDSAAESADYAADHSHAPSRIEWPSIPASQATLPPVSGSTAMPSANAANIATPSLPSQDGTPPVPAANRPAAELPTPSNNTAPTDGVDTPPSEEELLREVRELQQAQEKSPNAKK